MSETFCGTLLFVLVPLVTGLNALLIAQVKGLRSEVAMRRSSDHPNRDGATDG